MIDKSIKEMIENNAMALATSNENGNPHVIALGDVKVVEANKILITDNHMSKTVKNLRKNNNVALAVWSRNWEEDCRGYELIGTAEYLTLGKWFDFVKNMEENEGERPKAAILVTVKEIKKLA